MCRLFCRSRRMPWSRIFPVMKKDLAMFVANPSTSVPPTIAPNISDELRWNMRMPGRCPGRSSQSGGVEQASKNCRRTAGTSRSALSSPSIATWISLPSSRWPRGASSSSSPSASGSPMTVCSM